MHIYIYVYYLGVFACYIYINIPVYIDIYMFVHRYTFIYIYSYKQMYIDTLRDIHMYN